jgi:hypothetical protein
MTCEQFQELLPEMGSGNRNTEYETHLRSCQACWGLMADLSAISRQARSLQASEEPGPHVWNAIETALLKEGLIRTEQQPVLVLKRAPRWNPAWWFPVAASALIVFGIFGYQIRNHRSIPGPESSVRTLAKASSDLAPVFSHEDQEFLKVVATQTPDMRAKYEQGLREVNAYIEDARESAESNPNDEDIQRYLMNAYDQKAMLYEMALDRSQQ